jgi:hypothetical protein
MTRFSLFGQPRGFSFLGTTLPVKIPYLLQYLFLKFSAYRASNKLVIVCQDLKYTRAQYYAPRSGLINIVIDSWKIIYYK